MWRASRRGEFEFGIVWNLAVFVTSAIVLVAFPRWIVLILLPLWVSGIAWHLFVVDQGKRGATLKVRPGRLSIEETGLWGTRGREWSATEVDSIRCAPFGDEMDGDADEPEFQLVVTGRHGSTFHVLRGRDEEVLTGIATAIAAALEREDNGRS